MDKNRILLLEDKPVDAQVVRLTLEKAGFDALDITSSEDEFVRALQSNHYRAIVSDNSIPGAAADHSIKLAREYMPGVPFISISGAVSEKDGALLLSQGAADYISKDQLWRLPFVLQKATGAGPMVFSTKLAAFSREFTPENQESLLVLIGAIQTLSLARNLNDITATVRTAARQMVKADGATFVIKERDYCYYADEDAISPLWKGMRFPLNQCVSGWVMSNKEQISVPDITVDPRIPQDAYAPTFVKSLVMTPVRQSEPIAAIGTYWASSYTPTETDRQLLQMLADTTSVAIDNVCLYDELEARVADRTKMLEAANEELHAFSYSVAHDLKSPLHGIHQITNMLLAQEKMDPQECKTVFEAIGNDALRMTDMIAALLKLYSLSLNDLRTEKWDMTASAEQIFANLKQQYPERNVRTSVAPGLTASGDPSLFHLLLEILINNAWKFTSKKDDSTIEVGRNPNNQADTTRDIIRAGSNAPTVNTFFVKDNGAGFDMRYAAKLFKPFQRLHTAREFDGTGIGLATTNRIIKRYHGHIWAEAEKNEGATFFFTLPAAT